MRIRNLHPIGLMIQRFLAVAALVATMTAPAFAADCNSVTFSLTQTLSYGTGDYVENLFTVDYDHDNKLDVVGTIRNSAGTTLHAWRGLGNGTFDSAVSLGTTDVRSLAAGDVNNDGYVDLVGANYAGGKYFVRLGNATGFDAPTYTILNFSPFLIRTGNFDGDANVDMLLAGYQNGVFALYHGIGNGTFTEVQRRNNPPGITGAYSADFDGDGRFDMATSARYDEGLFVFFRNPDGTFANPVWLHTQSFPNDVQLADFNEDGLPDLATTTWYYGTIEVFLNTGSRTFGAPLTLRGGPPGHGGNELPLALTDVNGDAHVDIIAGGVNNPTVVTYLGRGNGTFASGSWFQTNVHALSLALGDFDGDTELDLAIGAFSNLLSASRSCATQVDLRAVSPVITTGMPAPLQVLVSGVAADTPLPLGTVTFREGATTLGSNNIDAKGFAQFDASGLSTGDHAIIAEFSGNTTLGAATSTSILQKVTTSITTTTFVFPAAGSSYGKQFTFSVVVRNQSNAEISGVYVLTVDGVETFRVIGTTFLSLAPGQHTFSARFFGDSVNPPSETGPVVITTAKAAVGMANVGDVTVPLGSAHNIRISVSGPSGVLAPTGTVQLMRGTTLLGAGTLTGGIASVSATLERGTHEVIATYSGDGNFAARSASFTLTVVQNAPLAIDARGLQDGIAIRAVVPANANAMTLYRSVSGSGVWTMVAGWSTSSEVDSWASLKRGTLYDYRLDVNVGGVLQSSNIDSALFFNDDPLSVAATTVKRIHFTELRDAINALRANAGLQPFNFDDTFDTHEVIRAAHVTAMRNAVAEARATLGMAPLTFTDATPTGMAIRAVHIRELRDATH